MTSPKFDPTITFGNILTMVVLVATGFLAYLSIEVRITTIDSRTADYGEVRDQVKNHEERLEANEQLASGASADRRVLINQLGELKAQVSAINTKLEERLPRRAVP